MTVQELRAELENWPPDMRVTVDGYEGGLCDVEWVKSVWVLLDHNTSDWDGPHEPLAPPDLDKHPDAVPILNIGRKEHSHCWQCDYSLWVE